MTAVAGAGKSTTAVQAARVAKGRVGFVAFNKHITEELQQKLGTAAQACTLHALGFAAVRKRYPDTQVDGGKLVKLAKAIAPAARYEDSMAAQQLARLCKYTLADESDASALNALVEHYGIDLTLDFRGKTPIYELAAQLVERSAADLRTIDYDDMVWIPVRGQLPVDQFDLLMVDECQDLNRCQQTLALMAAGQGRLCLIGDPRQAIYGFTGADCDAIPHLGKHLAGLERRCADLPLTVTFRCPLSHVEMVQRIVPEIQARDDAPDGVIRTAASKEIREQVAAGDLVIGRKNAPLVGMTLRLILAGVKATMRGRDVGKGMATLVARLRPSDVKDLIKKLAEYKDREEQRLVSRDAPASAFESLEDRVDCLSQAATQCETLDALDRFLQDMFDDKTNPGEAVVLSSVHRAKGLEADRVFVLDPASLPLIRRDSKDWERQQEKNLCYVACTRAKHELVFQDRVPEIFRGSKCVNASISQTGPSPSSAGAAPIEKPNADAKENKP